MRLLFKLGQNPPQNPTVSDTDIREFVPSFHRNMDWLTARPFINPATRKYLIPHIGRAYYDFIADKFDTDAALTESEQEALELMKRVVAFGVSYDFSIEMNIRLSDTGPQQTSDQEGTSSPPSQWAFSTKNWNTITEMDRYLDQLLVFLDQKVKAGETEFDLYKNSDQYENEGSDFFRSVEEMDQYLNIRGSRRAFKSIARYFKEAERKYILPIIGEDFSNELKSQYLDGSLNQQNKNALILIQRCVAQYGLFESIPHISCVLQADSIVIVSTTDGFNSRSISNTLFGQAMIERVRQHAQQEALKERRELINHLLNNADDYPTYRDSTAYPDETTTLNGA
ncbi:MAG: DUF6712 family protein, partial [Bacteroidota bacterium]